MKYDEIYCTPLLTNEGVAALLRAHGFLKASPELIQQQQAQQEHQGKVEIEDEKNWVVPPEYMIPLHDNFADLLGGPWQNEDNNEFEDWF